MAQERVTNDTDNADAEPMIDALEQDARTWTAAMGGSFEIPGARLISHDDSTKAPDLAPAGDMPPTEPQDPDTDSDTGVSYVPVDEEVEAVLGTGTVPETWTPVGEAHGVRSVYAVAYPATEISVYEPSVEDNSLEPSSSGAGETEPDTAAAFEAASLREHLDGLGRPEEADSVTHYFDDATGREAVVKPVLGTPLEDLLGKWYADGMPEGEGPIDGEDVSQLVAASKPETTTYFTPDADVDNVAVRSGHGGGSRASFVNRLPRPWDREDQENTYWDGVANVASRAHIAFDDLPIEIQDMYSPEEWEDRLALTALDAGEVALAGHMEQAYGDGDTRDESPLSRMNVTDGYQLVEGGSDDGETVLFRQTANRDGEPVTDILVYSPDYTALGQTEDRLLAESGEAHEDITDGPRVLEDSAYAKPRAVIRGISSEGIDRIRAGFYTAGTMRLDLTPEPQRLEVA